eukprot:gene7738-biopygen1529
MPQTTKHTHPKYLDCIASQDSCYASTIPLSGKHRAHSLECIRPSVLPFAFAEYAASRAEGDRAREGGGMLTAPRPGCRHGVARSRPAAWRASLSSAPCRAGRCTQSQCGGVRSRYLLKHYQGCVCGCPGANTKTAREVNLGGGTPGTPSTVDLFVKTGQNPPGSHPPGGGKYHVERGVQSNLGNP